MPQRGKLLVKIWERTLCRPASRPSRNGELAEIASSNGSTGRKAVADLDRAVGAADPDVHVRGERVVAPGHVLEAVLDAVVVVGVDDALLAVVGPRMRAGGAEHHVVGRGQREQPSAHVALRVHRGRVSLAATGADLDLGGDQLAGDRPEQDRVRLRAVTQLLEARRQPEVRRIEDRELLLEADREVRRLLEAGIPAVEVDVAQAR